MPYKIRKVGSSYQVVNADTGKVHAKHTTKAKAEAQVRLLHATDHGYKPDKVVRRGGVTYNITYTGKKSGKAKS